MGQTSDLQKRLIFHNEILENSYTSKYRPWQLIYTEKFESRSEAMKREKQLKTSRGRDFAWQKVKEFLENNFN